MGFHNLNQSDWQNFIYLLIVLILLVSGLLSRSQMNWAKIAKYLGAWALIIFITIGFYSYRFELKDFGKRILGEINPTEATITQSGNIVVHIANDGHFYINLILNNTDVRFMIDTGASDIVLNAKEARRVGINFKDLNFNRSYQTANGISWGASATIDKIRIGTVEFDNVEVSVNSAEMGTSLLGMSFLRRFKRYEFYHDRLELSM